MSIKTPYGMQNLFSLACRERCMINFRNLRAPKMYPNIQGRPQQKQVDEAVLLPLCKLQNQTTPSLMYCVRNPLSQYRAGQIAFPSCVFDKKDTAVISALEAVERSIGVPPHRVDVWGTGRPVASLDGCTVSTPVVGTVTDLEQRDFNINPSEISEVVTVSIEQLCDPGTQFYTQFTKGFILPVYVIDDFKIWGDTAYLTHLFLSSLLPRELYTNEWMRRKMIEVATPPSFER